MGDINYIQLLPIEILDIIMKKCSENNLLYQEYFKYKLKNNEIIKNIYVGQMFNGLPHGKGKMRELNKYDSKYIHDPEQTIWIHNNFYIAFKKYYSFTFLPC